jgi:hypothetical protein
VPVEAHKKCVEKYTAKCIQTSKCMETAKYKWKRGGSGNAIRLEKFLKLPEA